MNSLSAARAFIGDSLGFHIIFALCGVGLPFVLGCIEALSVRYKDVFLLSVAKKISQVMVLLVTIGVVSGTLIAFQLAVVWPGLIDFGGDILGLPFMLEGYAFLLEVIFLAAYLASWKKARGYAHPLLLVPVTLGAMLSAVCITVANAWMNAPSGFTLVDGKMTDVHLWQGLLTPTAFFEVSHSIVAYVMTVAITVLASVVWYAWKSGAQAHEAPSLRRALSMLLVIVLLSEGALAVLGDASLRYLSKSEPAKFAAIELVETSGSHQPYLFGGRYNETTQKVEGAFAVQNMLSIMTGYSPEKEISGLDAIAPDNRPLLIVHTLFEIKMGLTSVLVGLSMLFAYAHWRKKTWLSGRKGAYMMVGASLTSFALVELGWMVTELGRQPYAIVGYLRTSDAFVHNADVVRWGFLFPCVFVLLFGVMIFGLRKILVMKSHI